MRNWEFRSGESAQVYFSQTRTRLSMTVAAAFLLAAAAVGVYWFQSRPPRGPAQLSSYLPVKDAVLLYIDVDAIRKSGLLTTLAGSKPVEDAEYRAFVGATGFDYRHDLSEIAGAFRNGTSYFVIRGSFDWPKLESYAKAHGGSCHSDYCALDGSAAHRRISFHRLGAHLMALASGPDDLAAYKVFPKRDQLLPAISTDPLWMAVPAALINRSEAIPTGARAFTSLLNRADRIVFSAGAQDDHLQLDVNVTCANVEAASTLLVQLEDATNTLRKWARRDAASGDAGALTGALISGSFRREDRHVLGVWPVSRELLTALTGGAN